MKYCFSIVLLLLCAICQAQKTANVSGEYKYIVPENLSIEAAKRIAIERAQNEAIAAEFGTVVSQTSTSVVKNENGKSHTSFSSFGGTESKGEWLADTRAPEVNVVYENNTFVVTAKVWGKAREIKQSDIDLMIKTLCNDIESERFKNNDRFAVKFKTPAKGFFSIFLIDDRAENAYCLLPYENGDGKARAVEKNTEYEFLSTKDNAYPYRENTILTTSHDLEYNRLVFIFSTNEFAMPLTDMGDYVMELSLDDFIKWLRKNRIKDVDMQTIEKTVEIRKK